MPGDVVAIEAGDIVPADGRLLRAATLEIAESALTGESLPVPRLPSRGRADTPLGDRTDMVYMNTNVTRGSGEFVVTATGMATEVGHISGMLQAQETDKTPLTRQLDKLTRQILWIAAVALLVSVVLNLARGDTFTAVFTAAVAFAIGALPENLPAVVTTILAYGTQALAKAGAIMKRLQSTETLGSTSAINSDKTGTLTLNQMTAVQMAVVGRRYTIEGTGYSTAGQITRVAGSRDPARSVPAADGARLGRGDQRRRADRRPDRGRAGRAGGQGRHRRRRDPARRTRGSRSCPFDAAYKLMATFHRMNDDSGRDVVRCFVKGAPDQLLARAATVYDADAGPVPADGDVPRALPGREPAARRAGPAGHGHRAQGLRPGRPSTPTADLLPLVDGLELLALVGIVDPPRPDGQGGDRDGARRPASGSG